MKRNKTVTLTLIMLFIIGNVVVAQNENFSFYPEACVKSKTVTEVISDNHFCSTNNFNPIGRTFSSLSCNAIGDTENLSWHSWNRGDVEFIDAAPNCPFIGTNNTQYNSSFPDFDYGFWDCRDAVSNLRSNECLTCAHEFNHTDCYGVDATYRDNMRPGWPCTLANSENVNCTDLTLCKCTWRCSKRYKVLITATSIMNPTTGNDEIDGLVGSPRETLLTFEPKCESRIWQFMGRAPSENDTFESFIKFDGKVVTISVSPNGEFNVLILKGDFRLFKTFNGNTFQTQIPAEARQTSGTLSVELYASGVLIDATSFEVVGFNTCDIADCVFCANFFNTISCGPLTVKIAYVVMFAAFIIALCIACPMIFFVSYVIIKVLFSLFKNLVMWTLNKLNKLPGSSMVKEEFNNTYKKMKDEDSNTEELSDDSRIKKNLSVLEKMELARKRKNIALPFIFLFLGLTILPSVRACDNGLLNPMTLTNCIVEGSFETCSASFEIEIGLPFVGATSCITLTDAASGKFFGNVNITLESIAHTFPLNLNYYTSDRNVIVESHRLCFDLFNGFCHADLFSTFEPCTEINTNPNAFTGNIRGTQIFLDNRISGHPVRQTCRRVPGGSFNGCGAIQEGCVVSRAGVVPIGDVYSVNVAGAAGSLQSIVKVNFDHEGLDQIFTCQGNSIFCDDKNITLFIDDTSSTQEMSFAGQCVVKGPNTFVASGCSPLNTLNAASIGELQAASPSAFSTGNFNFANDLFEVTHNGNEDVYLVQPQAFKTVSQFPLPGFVSGLFMQEKQGKILINGTGSTRLRFKTKTPLTIKRKTSLVCPEVTFLAGSGCSQCSQGVTLNFTGSSSCAAGNIIVKDTNDETTLYTNSVLLDTTEKTFSLRLRTEKVENKFNLIFGSGEKAQTVQVTFTALVVVDLGNTSYVVKRGTVGDDPSNTTPLSFDASDFLTRAFLGRGTILEVVATVAIFIGGAILLGLFALFLIKTGRSYSILNKISRKKKE